MINTLITTSQSSNNELSIRANRIHAQISNPALSYINSLAATDTSGGRANARFILERFCRYFSGDSVTFVDWVSLCNNPQLLGKAISGFLRYKSEQKTFLIGEKKSSSNPYEHMHVTPILEGIVAIASDAHKKELLTKESYLTVINLIQRSDFSSFDPLDYGWHQSSDISFVPTLTSNLSSKVFQALEAFSCFCLTSCIHRFDWHHFLKAPLIQAMMSEYLAQGVIVQGEKNRDFSPATADNLYRMIRGVAEHHWLAENMDVERLQRIKAIKLPRGSRKSSGRYISLSELESILLVANTHPNPLRRIRDQAIFSMMYDLGLRRAEITSLTLKDIDWNENFINIIGKGNKQRHVFFEQNGKMAQVLKAWLDVCENGIVGYLETPNNPVFSRISKSKVPTNKPISTQTLNDICQWVMNNGINRRISPHDFRHSLATNLLSQQHDLLSVSYVMGHSSPNTTQRYDKRGDEALKKTISHR